ncbi:type II toxin-antitoxin system VapC family toxin [Metallosphaera hakonensis]|nr:PIN domain-containing protein [Metallosphaera hakonensis]
MEYRRYLIDTDVLFSKKFLKYKGDGLVTATSVYEFLTVIRERYLELYHFGNKDRAKGYLRFLGLVLGEIKSSIIDVTSNDFIHAGSLVFERDLNVGDAINVAVAKRLNLVIVSEDKDYDRIRDLVTVTRP